MVERKDESDKGWKYKREQERHKESYLNLIEKLMEMYLPMQKDIRRKDGKREFFSVGAHSLSDNKPLERQTKLLKGG
jgi:hypothetical protein